MAPRDRGSGGSGGRHAYFGGEACADLDANRGPSHADPCRPSCLRRMLSPMTDAVARLNAPLEGRYAIERDPGEGVIGEGRHPIRLRTGVRPTDREPRL
jgi:hypothetical protein